MDAGRGDGRGVRPTACLLRKRRASDARFSEEPGGAGSRGPIVVGAQRRRNMSGTATKGPALITGASTGIGAVYADRLARRGYDLILVARRKQDLEKLANVLRAETGVRIEVLPADLYDEADLVRVEQVLHDDPSISLLVNNAGAATLRPFASADIGRLEREIQLNVLAPTRLAHAALTGLLARNRGGIVNIASVMSQMVQPGNSVYGG